MIIPRWGLWLTVLEPYLVLVAVVVAYHTILSLLRKD